MGSLKYYDKISKTWKYVARGVQGPAGQDDKHFEQNIVYSTIVVAKHNLGKRPSVTIIDTSGDEVEGMIQYIDINTIKVIFSTPFDGIIICN